jgi:hypothetical protein
MNPAHGRFMDVAVAVVPTDDPTTEAINRVVKLNVLWHEGRIQASDYIGLIDLIHTWWRKSLRD